MKKSYYWFVGIAIVAILAYLKYDYDQREKERQRVEQVNQQVRDAANVGKDRFNNNLKPSGNSVFGSK